MRCDNCGVDLIIEADGICHEHCLRCDRYLCSDCAEWDNFENETICDSCRSEIEFTFPATTNKNITEETNG